MRGHYSLFFKVKRTATRSPRTISSEGNPCRVRFYKGFRTKFFFEYITLQGSDLLPDPDRNLDSSLEHSANSESGSLGFIYRVSYFRPRTREVDLLDGFLNAHTLRSMIGIYHPSAVSPGFRLL